MSRTLNPVGIALLVWAFGLAAMVNGAVAQTAGSDSEDFVRAAYERRCVEYPPFLAKAYGLSDAERVQLENEMRSRLDAMMQNREMAAAVGKQVADAYAEAQKRLAPGQHLSDEECEKIEAPLREIEAKEPLSHENVMKYIETKLAPDRATSGHRRVAEMQDELRKNAVDKAALEGVAEAARRKQIRVGMEDYRREDARVTPAGKPMPKAEYSPPPTPFVTQGNSAPVLPPSVSRPPPQRHMEPTLPPRAEAPKIEQHVIAPPPAPPLDEWDRRVDQVAQRYSFTPAQRTKSQSILKDLRGRAMQYRASHVEDWDRLKRASDRRAASVEEKQLNEPLDQLFQELQERLDELATAEQRAASGSAKHGK